MIRGIRLNYQRSVNKINKIMIALAKGDYATAQALSTTLVTAITANNVIIQASVDPTGSLKAGDSGDPTERTV